MHIGCMDVIYCAVITNMFWPPVWLSSWRWEQEYECN